MTPERLDGLTMLLMTLPGIAFTYNGDEIGMTDYDGITFADTKDAMACYAGSIGYESVSRDPSRTPFHWDSTTNAGFNEGFKTWIPVNPNYPTNNLQAQRNDPSSVYSFYTDLAELRRNETFVVGSFKSFAVNENVFAIVRELGGDALLGLVNLAATNQTIDISSFITTSTRFIVIAAGTKSFLRPG